MNYHIFEDITGGRIVRQEQETEDDFMARVLKGAAVRSREDPQQINTMMEPEFVSCSFEKEELCYRFRAADWCLNPTGTLHGGIMAAACDITMGILARYLNKGIRAATVDLSVHYMRPVNRGEEYAVTARMKKNGKNLKYMECEARSCRGNRLLAAASAIFM